MVRRKIEIERIENAAQRYTTFSKRRHGLFKKTLEFCEKVDGIGAVIAFTKAGNAFSMAHPHIDTVLSRYYYGTQENDVVREDSLSSSLDQLTGETQKRVSEGMARRQVELSLMNVGFWELDALEKVFTSILDDTRRREEELRGNDGHAD